MDELFALLIPLGCGCVLPILVIWLTIRKEMNETNTRTKIVLAAIEKTPDMNIEELIEKISPKKKLLKETLLEKLMWGWICAILGPISKSKEWEDPKTRWLPSASVWSCWLSALLSS